MSSILSHHSYGHIPDRRDQRDHLYAAPLSVLSALPTSVDLRPQCAPVMDQLQLGSCTSNAIAAALEFDQKKQNLPEARPSRLFIYYNERSMEGTVNSDAGAMIRDGIKSVNKQGACSESMWLYDISKFTVKPSSACYQTALQHKAVSYQRVTRSLAQMKGCLAAGFPFVMGFTVYESFESDQVAQTGVVPMPSHREQVLGGHAVLCCGFDDASQRFYVQNSWGTEWGMSRTPGSADRGFFTMPYAYLLSSSLSSDFWTIRSTN
jgi:C1A family cysteine protease